MSDTRSESALRQLHAADAEIAALRGGSLAPEQARGFILRVANSVDRTLRRLLRDDERADISVRLQALAPDELTSAEVLAELRRTERLPMNVAAAVHELLEVRRRLERGGAVEEGDAGRATFAVDRLSEELIRPRVASPPPPATLELPDEESHEVFEAPVHTSRRFRGGGDLPVWGIAAGALIGIIAIAAWFLLDRGPNQLEQGIALFRTGAYADAASHFWRYAEENPDDPTPQLYLARIHRRMDRPELAAEALRIAQNLAPSDPAVHRELGFLLLDTGRADVAVDRFRTAIDMDSTSSEGWVGLVRALRESGRGNEIEGVLNDAPAEVRALLLRPGTG